MGTGGHDADMSSSTRGDLDSSMQAGSDSRLTDGTSPTDLGMPQNQRRDGWMLTDSGQIELTDGSVLVEEGDRRFVCRPVQCEDKVLECGDCIDNDGDGNTDWYDPECLGPCDNTEGPGLSSGVGGETRATCRLDCYFDFGNGPGNDDCRWDHRCDPLEPAGQECGYEPNRLDSRECPLEQSERCEDACLAITPNGCDCFGCCTFPALAQAGPNGAPAHVWIGAMDERNESTCTLDTLLDSAACPRCTPVDACNNECGECEICVGKPTVPDHCFGDDEPHDAGLTDAGGPAADAGARDTGAPPPAGDRCPEGVQPCGLPGDFSCPDTRYCITGCCRVAP